MTAATLFAHKRRIQIERSLIVPTIVDGMTFDTVHAEVRIVHRKGVEPQ